MLDYLLKSGVCLAIFLFFYKLLLERESIHTFKRYYLLGVIILSFIIPGIVFTEVIYIEPSTVSMTNITDYEPKTNSLPIENPIDYKYWCFLIIYSLGVSFLSLKFLKNLNQIRKTIKNNPKHQENKITKVLLTIKIVPHTFFHYIFLNKFKYESNEIPAAVLIHEETHAKQKHSVDILILEILQIVFWFNPLIYLFKKTIKLNHEFLADSAVLNKGLEKSDYQKILLAFSSNATEPQLANALNYSSIKKRFTVMKKQTSRKSIFLRSTLIIPLLALLLYSFSERKVVEKHSKVPITYESSSNDVIKIEINEKQEIFVGGKITPLKEISTLLIQTSKSFDLKNDSKSEVYIEAKGNLDIKLLALIKNQILNAGLQLTKVACDTIIIEDNEMDKNYKGVTFIAKDTLFIQLKNGKFIKGTSSSKLQEEDATKKQIVEYNKLAKKYNAITKSNNVVIKKQEANRMSYLYSIMSQKERKGAESFPMIPPMPESPKAPKVTKGEISNIPPPPAPTNTTTENKQSKWVVSTAANRNSRQENPGEPLPPPVPAIGLHANKNNYSKELKNSINTYLKKNEEYEIAVAAYTKNGTGNTQEIWDTYNQAIKLYVDYYNLAKKEGNFVQPMNNSNGGLTVEERKRINRKRLNNPPPPAPPTPKSPLDHVIEMAKKGADFYYEGNKISSNRAIELLKLNTDLNIDSRSSNSGTPTVRISREPIKIN